MHFFTFLSFCGLFSFFFAYIFLHFFKIFFCSFFLLSFLFHWHFCCSPSLTVAHSILILELPTAFVLMEQIRMGIQAFKMIISTKTSSSQEGKLFTEGNFQTFTTKLRKWRCSEYFEEKQLDLEPI